MRNKPAKKTATAAILVICAAFTIFLCFGRARPADLENSYADYIKTRLPYENLIVPVNMEHRGTVSIYTEPGAPLASKFVLEEKRNGKWNSIAKSPAGDTCASLSRILDPGTYRIRISMMKNGAYTEYRKKYEPALHT